MAIATMYDEGYITGHSNRRDMKGVVSTADTPNNDTIPKLQASRALSRDMYMNTPMATAALRRARTNIAGSGLKPQSRINGDFLGLTREEVKTWETNVERQFETWATSKMSDYDGQQDFYESQGLAAISALMNGDMFYMLPWKRPYRAGNWPFELRIKQIEADLVRNPKGYRGWDEAILDTGYPGGIQKNKNGEWTHVWISDKYPSEVDAEKFNSVPVRSKNGRQNIHHLAQFDRIGQSRGMPWLAPVLADLKNVSRLSDSVLKKFIVSSFFTVFVKDMSGLGGTLDEPFLPEQTLGGGGGEGVNSPQEPKNRESAYDYELGTANIINLDDDKEIQVADPKSSDKEFESFFNSYAIQLGAAIEVPSEQLLLHFRTSYSSARAALIEAWKFWKTRRTWIAKNYCQPIWEAFIEELILKGRIIAPGFFDDPVIKKEWCKCAWIGAGQGQIDPLKETKAAVLKIDSNLATHEDQYTAETGEKWDEMIPRRAREEETLIELNLKQDPTLEEAPEDEDEEEETPDNDNEEKK
tara:strand:- start:17905 stop:19485 length:1581 start_codon:yes stop_codon:yes gene_type:complete